MQRLSVVGGDRINIDWSGVLNPEEYIMTRRSSLGIYDSKGDNRTKDVITKVRYETRSLITLEIAKDERRRYNGLYQIISFIETNKDRHHSQTFELSIAQYPWSMGATISIEEQEEERKEEETKIRMILFS